MDIKNLLELQPSTWFKIAITCLSTFLPWTLHLYLFKEDLFIDLDVFKIILLASTLSIPMWVANFIISCIIFFNKKCPLFNLEIELLFYFRIIIDYIFIIFVYSIELHIPIIPIHIFSYNRIINSSTCNFYEKKLK